MHRVIKPLRLERVLWLAVLWIAMPNAWSASLWDKMRRFPDASLVVVDPNGQVVAEKSSGKPLVPASICKVITAYYAIQRLGLAYRFYTDFYLDTASRLWVKGWGDPWLDSEQLELAVQHLRKAGVLRVSGISVDTSAFGEDLADWQDEHTDNPYDALPSALAVNFNSVALQRKKGRLSSSDPHTPLTPTAIRVSQRYPGNFTGRVNLGRDPHLAEVYTAEVLGQFLTRYGIGHPGVIQRGVLPAGVRLVYRHTNTRNLQEILQAMLKYSNNFIANQLFLRVGAETYGYPATMFKARQAMFQSIRQDLDWNNFWIEDGAGLSRKTRVNAVQMAQLLARFSPYKGLLPPKEGRYMYAKTGTMTGVSSLAGYVHKDDGWYRFALLINHPVDGAFRYQLIREILGP